MVYLRWVRTQATDITVSKDGKTDKSASPLPVLQDIDTVPADWRGNKECPSFSRCTAEQLTGGAQQVGLFRGALQVIVIPRGSVHPQREVSCILPGQL